MSKTIWIDETEIRTNISDNFQNDTKILNFISDLAYKIFYSEEGLSITRDYASNLDLFTMMMTTWVYECMDVTNRIYLDDDISGEVVDIKFYQTSFNHTTVEILLTLNFNGTDIEASIIREVEK